MPALGTWDCSPRVLFPGSRSLGPWLPLDYQQELCLLRLTEAGHGAPLRRVGGVVAPEQINAFLENSLAGG